MTASRRWAQRRQVRRRQHRVATMHWPAGVVLHEVLEMRHAQTRRFLRHRQIRHLRQKKHSTSCKTYRVPIRTRIIGPELGWDARRARKDESPMSISECEIHEKYVGTNTLEIHYKNRRYLYCQSFMKM